MEMIGPGFYAHKDWFFEFELDDELNDDGEDGESAIVVYTWRVPSISEKPTNLRSFRYPSSMTESAILEDIVKQLNCK